MPWKEEKTMDLRYSMIQEYLTGTKSISELADAYGISRVTVYKWLERYDSEGSKGLQNRSSKPHSTPFRTPPEIEALILDINERKGWLAKKIRGHLRRTYPEIDAPARSTVHGILERAGRTNRRRRKRNYKHPGKPFVDAQKPNDVWAIDFKGDFVMGNGSRCYPLTITDTYSRFLIEVKAMDGPKFEGTKRAMTRAFEEYGLPSAILSDNGTPFSSKAIGRLSRLSVWWIQYGIYPILTQPGNPQQNGKHERMHRELKRETTRPPAYNSNSQQRKFNTFKHDYNYELEHGGIDERSPSELFRPSNNTWPGKAKEFEYPSHFEVRKVSANGGFRWEHDRIPLTTTLEGEYVGLEEIDDGIWKVFYRDFYLGIFNEFLRRVEDEPGKFNRTCK